MEEQRSRTNRWTRFQNALKTFFFPPQSSRRIVRLLPYITLGVLTFAILISGVYVWDYTNSPEFCGTSCHTMPPEFSTYLVSPHARIDCVECHIGRGFIATRITRKAGDIRHIVSLAFKNYEFPIQADDLQPARETCEKCHFPEKFSDDSLREIKHFSDDLNNTPESIFLTLKTGGGTRRQGLGRGIHWHIENQVLFFALDSEETEIPYIRVLQDDGAVIEYLDIDSPIDPTSLDESDLIEMDCITCHNRITHQIYTPEAAVEQLLSRGEIASTIPEIRRKGVEVMRAEYSSNEIAIQGIAGLDGYYRTYYPDFYNASHSLIDDAISKLQEAYLQSVFPEQKTDWDSHPNNIGHQDSPGCFRCHDGKHLNAQQEAVRLECNLCHSIPVVAGPADFVAEIEISRGPEPQSHLNANWITLHREVFDDTCANCHTTENPGGTDNTSFCSNSACHGSVWEFAGFDAPALREILQPQIPQPEETDAPEGTLTFEGSIGQLLGDRCGDCHGENGLQGLNLTTYEATMRGGINGRIIIPGEPTSSPMIEKTTGEVAHFAQFTSQELARIIDWITAGAPP